MADTKSVADKYIVAVIAIIIVLAGVSAIINSGLSSLNTTTSTIFSNGTDFPVNTSLNATPIVYTTTAGTMNFEGVITANSSYNIFVYLNGVLLGNNTGIPGSYHIDFTGVTALNGRNNVTFESTAPSGAINVTSTNLIYTAPVSNQFATLYALILALVPLGLIIGALYYAYKSKK